MEHDILSAQDRVVALEYQLFCQLREAAAKEVGAIQVSAAAAAHLRLQSAVGVAMAAERLGPEALVSAQDLAPVYLRLSQAERERLARLGQS